jgi:hypothetical protein
MRTRLTLMASASLTGFTALVVFGFSAALARQAAQDVGRSAGSDAAAVPIKTTKNQSTLTQVDTSAEIAGAEAAKPGSTRSRKTKSETTQTESTETGATDPTIDQSVKIESEVNTTQTTQGNTTAIKTESTTTKTERLNAAPTTKKTAKTGADPADAKKNEPPIPLLIGRYESAYHVLSVRPDLPVRFFAAKFKLPLASDGGDGAADLKGNRAYELFQQKAEEASRIVEWNQFSLVPRGVISQEQVDLRQQWTLLGVFCPSCDEQHWTAVGYDDNKKKFQIYSNNRRVRPALEVRERAWSSRSFLRPATNGTKFVVRPPFGGHPLEHVTLSTASVDEGGWLLESFQDESRSGKTCGIELELGIARPQTDIELQLGAGHRQTGVTFAFLAPFTTVSLVGDYIEKPIAPRTQAISIDLFDEQIHYYAVLVSAHPPSDEILAMIGPAADFGRRIVQGKGTSLNYFASVKRQRVTDGKVLILGVFNASRSRNQWLSIEGADGKPLKVLGSHAVVPVRSADGLYQITTGGLNIGIQIKSGRENSGDVEYMFLAPE